MDIDNEYNNDNNNNNSQNRKIHPFSILAYLFSFYIIIIIIIIIRRGRLTGRRRNQKKDEERRGENGQDRDRLSIERSFQIPLITTVQSPPRDLYTPIQTLSPLLPYISFFISLIFIYLF